MHASCIYFRFQCNLHSHEYIHPMVHYTNHSVADQRMDHIPSTPHREYDLQLQLDVLPGRFRRLQR